jgi:hypothetical protein
MRQRYAGTGARKCRTRGLAGSLGAAVVASLGCSRGFNGFAVMVCCMLRLAVVFMLLLYSDMLLPAEAVAARLYNER